MVNLEDPIVENKFPMFVVKDLLKDKEHQMFNTDPEVKLEDVIEDIYFLNQGFLN